MVRTTSVSSLQQWVYTFVFSLIHHCDIWLSFSRSGLILQVQQYSLCIVHIAIETKLHSFLVKFSFSGNRPCDNCSIAWGQNAQYSYNPPLQWQNISLQAGQSPPLVVNNIRLDSVLPPLQIRSIFFFRKSLSAKCLYQNVLSACLTLLLRLWRQVIMYGWGGITFSTKTKKCLFFLSFKFLHSQ